MPVPYMKQTIDEQRENLSGLLRIAFVSFFPSFNGRSMREISLKSVHRICYHSFTQGLSFLQFKR